MSRQMRSEARDRFSAGDDADDRQDPLLNASLQKGLGVLAAFDRGVPSLSLTQIIAITGLEKSAAQRFTYTLTKLGYLRKDPATRHYSLSARMLHLGSSYLRNNALVERSSPYLSESSKRLNETINLMELDGEEIIITARMRGPHVISPNVVIGSSFPWHVTSAGQVLVAHLPDNAGERLLRTSRLVAYASRTITNKEKLRDRLRQIRSEGFGLACQESFDGDISVSAPVFGPDGTVIAAVGAALLTTEWTVADARARIAPAIVELARTISASSQTNRPRPAA